MGRRAASAVRRKSHCPFAVYRSAANRYPVGFELLPRTAGGRSRRPSPARSCRATCTEASRENPLFFQARISRTSSWSMSPRRANHRSTPRRTCSAMAAMASGVSAVAGRNRTASPAPGRPPGLIDRQHHEADQSACRLRIGLAIVYAAAAMTETNGGQRNAAHTRAHLHQPCSAPASPMSTCARMPRPSANLPTGGAMPAAPSSHRAPTAGPAAWAGPASASSSWVRPSAGN
jgi:hypothetical protein